MNSKEANTKYCRNWRKNNREYYNGLMRNIMKSNYEKDKDKISTYKKQHYQWKKEVARVMGVYSIYE